MHYSLVKCKDNYWWTVWLGRHTVENVSMVPNGRLIRVRNPEESAKAEAGLIVFST